MNREIEVKIGALILDPHNGTPIIVLKSLDSEKVLPIWVGSFEANAITSEIEKKGNSRPMTHDLLRNVLLGSGWGLSKSVITDLRENTFFAALHFTNEQNKTFYIDARPSDAIALAMRFDCPIYVNEELFSTARRSNEAEDDLLENDLKDTSVGTDDGEEWPDLIG